MNKRRRNATDDGLNDTVTLAQGGDRAALERVIRAVQPDVYGLALRFLWHPEDAEDASQEILVRIVTHLGTFRGASSFRSWVYRVASNALISMKKSRAEQHAMSIDAFAGDIDQGLSDAGHVPASAEDAVLLEEVKVGCTLAMLLCLDRAHRLAFILGEIMELGHTEAAQVLDIKPAAFRKRLSRARGDITHLMRAKCGLFDAVNECRCRRRVDTAIRLGRVDPKNLLFASASEQVRRFPEVLKRIRALDEAQRAAALYRANQTPEFKRDFGKVIEELLA